MIERAGQIRAFSVSGDQREPEDLRVIGDLPFDVGRFETGVCDPAYPNHALLLCPISPMPQNITQFSAFAARCGTTSYRPVRGRAESTSTMIATSCSPKPMSMQCSNNSAARSRIGVATPALAANASTV